MKTIPILILLASLSATAVIVAAERPANSPAPADAATPEALTAGQAADSAGSAAKPPAAIENGTDSLRLNFRGASLDQVLNYFSEAAGFVINVKPGTSVRGKVDVWSGQPVTREEALNLLFTVLNQNNLAAIRTGRTLTIVNKDEAKTQNIPVISESDPAKIPQTDQMVTQIIPVRFVEVAQLIKDLHVSALVCEWSRRACSHLL